MQTGEEKCLAALQEAAEILDESPTKAAYEELGLTPASATIIRVVGGWNEAKERAGLVTNPSSGSRVTAKPEDVTLPEDTDWAELSVDQRWHYRNRERNTERTLQRRARLRSWANQYKRERGCQDSEATDHRFLEFHHTSPENKRMAVGDMITYGFGRAKLREEIEKCVVLCANGHRRRHHDKPADGARKTTRERKRAWLYERKREAGCTECGETDPRCLVFHHGGDEKTASIAEMVANGRNREKIQTEVDRCQVWCANCYRKEHFTAP